MRKIIFYGAVSLDGYLVTKTDDLQWLFDTPTGEQTTYETFYEIIGTTIIGRKTYQEAKKYLEIEAIYPEKRNFVFSTNAQLQLPDAEAVHEEPVASLRNLQMAEGEDIWVVGGGRLIKPLIEHQMIDEWYTQIAPVLLGDGIPLFQKGAYEARFELLDTTRLGELIESHCIRK